MLSFCALAVIFAQTPTMVIADVTPEPVVEAAPGIELQGSEAGSVVVEDNVMDLLLNGLGTGSPIADINGDGVVNFFDIVAFISCINTGGACADLNGDGVVDFFDIQLFVSA